MYTFPASEVVETLSIDAVVYADALILPPKEATTIRHIEIFYRDTQIRQMFAHMHKRGYLFQVYKVGGVNDGELLYVSNDYQHPPYQIFSPPLEIKAGERILTKVFYNNETDREITIGVTSEDEMGILFYSFIE